MIPSEVAHQGQTFFCTTIVSVEKEGRGKRERLEVNEKGKRVKRESDLFLPFPSPLFLICWSEGGRRGKEGRTGFP